jgi:Metallo-beta-lactamase superfamily
MGEDSLPADDELEVSLFGPGIGECIVVHLGGGKWMIVDSCIPKGLDEPAALRYLDGLGIDVANDVALVVATHWHDDHIGGLSSVLNAARSAQFACSAAFEIEQFWTLVSYASEIKFIEHNSGVAEFDEILATLNERYAGRYRSGPDYYAVEGLRLYRGAAPFGEVCVEALSPSAQTITDQKGQILPDVLIDEPIRRFMAHDPNDLSVVLLIQTPGCCVLLGGDLEIGRDNRRGWRAIVESRTRPDIASSLYKVAHHGSPNADMKEIWTELLANEPIAIMAPYARGRKKLPTWDDVKRIKKAAGRVYCTVWPFVDRPKARSPIVDSVAASATRFRSAIKKGAGHIRLRAPIMGGGDISVETFHGACRM